MHRLKVTGIALALAGLAGTAQAANSPLIVWQGSVTITSATAGCSGLGVSVGDLFDSVYRPRLEPDEPPSGITLINGRSTQLFFNATTSSNDQMVGRGDFLGHFISSRATAIPSSTQSSFAGKYNFKVKPAVISSTTASITITGSLTNYFNFPSCTVGFLGAYQPRGN